jgi:hypothetical protein
MINAYPAVWHINIPGIVLMISTGLYGAVICQAAIICHPTPVSIEYGSPEFFFFVQIDLRATRIWVYIQPDSTPTLQLRGVFTSHRSCR